MSYVFFTTEDTDEHRDFCYKLLVIYNLHEIMKKLFLMFALFVGTALAGCTSEDSEIEKVDYYIKYIVKASATSSGIKSISVMTDSGMQTLEFSNQAGWEQTYGPVAKGFMAIIQVKGLTRTVEIHCCRGKEPFALKAIKNGETFDPVLGYTIDF